MGILPHAVLGILDPGPMQQVNRPVSGFRIRNVAMLEQGFAQLIAQRIGWIERGHRVLENHGHALAAQICHLAFRQLLQIDAVETDVSGAALRLAWQQAHQRQRCHRFPASRFADQAQHLAAPNLEIDAAHRMQHAMLSRQVYPQAFYVK